MARKEEEILVQQSLMRQLNRGQIDRRQFMSSMMVAGLGLTGVSAALSGCAAPAPAPAGGDGMVDAGGRPLTPSFYQWIEDLHPGIPAVNDRVGDVNYQIAPVEGFGIERFVAEAKDSSSTWDVYVGMTPFVEMTALIEADVIEPWDNYIPQEVLDDIVPAIRDECTVDGKLYSWPFLLDIAGMGWNSGITDAAGITAAPTTWDDYLAASQAIIDSEAAPFGCTFDSHGWRSLAPFAHSLSSDVYTADGLFDFTSEPAIESLMLMKKMMELSHPDILLEGASDGGVNGTPDEVAFAAQRVGLYTKYFNAPLRMANNWPDPSLLQLGALPKFSGSDGGTIFWTTGACLFKHGQNKEAAAEYVKELTYDAQIWQDSITGTPTAHPGQLPPYASLYADWDTNKPEWMPDFVGLIREQFGQASAITNHLFSLSQFQIAKPSWEKFLTGEVDNPMAAMEEARDVVLAELAKSS